jgi:hypothetical protein
VAVALSLSQSRYYILTVVWFSFKKHLLFGFSKRERTTESNLVVVVAIAVAAVAVAAVAVAVVRCSLLRLFVVRLLVLV